MSLSSSAHTQEVMADPTGPRRRTTRRHCEALGTGLWGWKERAPAGRRS